MVNKYYFIKLKEFLLFILKILIRNFATKESAMVSKLFKDIFVTTIISITKY